MARRRSLLSTEADLTKLAMIAVQGWLETAKQDVPLVAEPGVGMNWEEAH